VCMCVCKKRKTLKQNIKFCIYIFTGMNGKQNKPFLLYV
jgi:hypothetical protein